MGLVKLTLSEPNYCWDMLNEKKYGGISCLATSDVTENGLDEILVGRDDGVVEVYSLDESNEPRLRFTYVRKLNSHEMKTTLNTASWDLSL